jgi:hypothetical protein
MDPLARLFVGADLLGETSDGDGIAVRLHQPPMPIGEKRRHLVAYAAPGVSTGRTAALLRELADQLQGGCDP